MKAIDKLLFNTLAHKQGVNLPNIGTLKVESNAAKVSGKRTLNAPYSRVVFSKNNDSELPSLIDLIASHSGTEQSQAEQWYSQWSEAIKNDTTIHIDEVGEIKSDFFTPSHRLAQLLNPLADKSITIKPRIGKLKVLYYIIPIVIIVSAGYGLGQTNIVSLEMVASYLSPRPKEVVIKQLPSLKIVAVPAPVAIDSAQIIKQQIEQADTLYYVVIGVYSTNENAEKFIAKAKTKTTDTLEYNTLPIPNGKLLVTVFTCTNAEDAAHKRASISKLEPNSWIYKKNNK